MVDRVFKLAGLIGGGILALGTGAVGSHLAQPFLESKLNPERREGEERLQESLEDAEAKIERLGYELGQFQQTNETQNGKILSLQKNKKDLDEQIEAKTFELTKKNAEFEQKTKELKEQETINKDQASKISDLGSQISAKEGEITKEKKDKEAVEKQLSDINSRLALTDEDILSDKAIRESSLRINTRHIKWQSGSSGIATFEIIDHKGDKKSIKVKKPNTFSDHETKAKEIRSRGITFKLDQSFESWSKVVKVERYDIDYDFKATKETEKNAFTKNGKTTIQDINLSEYFNPQYYEEAFKVFLAIVFLDHFPLCHNLAETEDDKPYLFREDQKVNLEFSGGVDRKWDAFTETDAEKKKFISYIYSFNTIEDFIKYWTKKTVEFVRTGTVDLFDFLNPMFIEKNYQSS